ncbi:uncharacterized protein LOC127566648 [Pristis pectinata]|uniref:uncharacterized protein LOC127566648 n=1 Tax=Pristis pectinata TaxID=685728 RepID=UPI00223E4504|nr:uncharacterized protein LOC127566648 [Pristis pectinata]
MAEGGSGGDAVTSTSRKRAGGKLTHIEKVFKRFLPVGLSRKDDQDTGTTTPKQCRIESGVPMECVPSLEEREQNQPSGSGIRDGIQGHGTSPSEAIPCDVGGSLITESSSLNQGAEHQMLGSSVATMAEDANRGGDTVTSKSRKDTDPETTISELLAQCGDYQLFQLSNFYRERLKPAIEEGVERLSLMLRDEQHFSGQEHEKVTELVERKKRTESSKLLFSLVMEKGSRARRAMWESFVKMRNELPKLDKILNEIQELGPDPYEYMNIGRDLCDLSAQLKDVQQKHKEVLRAQTETLRVNTILMREKVKVFQLVDRYAELTVISTVRDRRLVEHELLARGRDHERWRKKHLRGELEKIRTDQLFQSSFSRSKWKNGRSAAVAGVPGIGKTTMVQKIVYDWATGKIYPHFQFVFSFKFRDLNSINCRINLRELVLDQYPYFGNILGEVWKNPEGLLFIFDGLDEFKHRIHFADRWRDTEPQHKCPDPEWWCEVSDIVYSLIQHKLLPGCSVLVTTRPTALHLLEKAEISVWAEILGFVGEERKEYFHKFFEDQTVAAAVFKHVEENEILYTMSYNPSYCWILGLALGPFFTQRHKDPQRVPKTVTQLYSYYIYNILKNHGREIDSPRDVLLRVGQMAYRGVFDNKIVFTDGDLINYNLQPSQFLSGFLMELLEREDCARSVVYTFPHLTIQEFVAALAQFLNPHPGDILKLLTEAHSTTDGRFEVFLRFVAGLSSPGSARGLEEFLGPFPHQTTCRVIDWVKEEVKRQSGNTGSEAGKRSLLNTLHYLFESQNRGLAQAALGSVETLSFSGLRLTPIDCAVLSHVIGLCDTIKHLDLGGCHIQCEGLQRLGPGLHKCRELGLENNDLGDSGVKPVSAALRDPECKIQRLRLAWNRLTDSGVEDLACALSTNRSLTELDLNGNKLGDSGVKPVSAALRDPECKIQRLRLWDVGLTDSGAEDLASALSTNRSLTGLDLGSNSLTDRCVPALRRLILTLPSLEWIWLRGNRFSSDGQNQLKSLQGTRRGLRTPQRERAPVFAEQTQYFNSSLERPTLTELQSAAQRNPERPSPTEHQRDTVTSAHSPTHRRNTSGTLIVYELCGQAWAWNRTCDCGAAQELPHSGSWAGAVPMAIDPPPVPNPERSLTAVRWAQNPEPSSKTWLSAGDDNLGTVAALPITVVVQLGTTVEDIFVNGLKPRFVHPQAAGAQSHLEKGTSSVHKERALEFGNTVMAEGTGGGGDALSSTFSKYTEPNSAVSELLTQWDDEQLFQLTKIYRQRLKQAIEERVEGLSWMLRQEDHFSGQDHERVIELAERGNRAESSTLFFSLVSGKGSRARRVMWESFVKMRNQLPKLDKILKEIQERDVQEKHKETLRTHTETLRVETILMREKVKVFQLVDRYAELTVISTVRDRTLVEHELLARGRDHEEWRGKHLRDRRDILKLLTEAHSMKDGRFEVFLRFVAGLSSPASARGLEEFLGPFPNQTICRVIDWVKEKLKRQSGNTWSEAGKRSLLNTLHYLFESQNRGLAQAALGSVETLSFSGLPLTPIDCAVLCHAFGLCDTIKHLDLWGCYIQCEGLQRLGPGLHKCRDLVLGSNDLGDSGVKLVSAALRDPECKIQRLELWGVGLTDSGAEDLASALSTNRSLTGLDLGSNSLTDRCVPALRRLILTLPSLERIWLRENRFSSDGQNQLKSLQGTRPGGVFQSSWDPTSTETNLLRMQSEQLLQSIGSSWSFPPPGPKCKQQADQPSAVIIMDTDLNSAISAFLSNCEDHQLFRLTGFYRDRLEQAIEEGVEGLGLMLTGADHFTGREYHSVTELAEKGNRAAASKLLLDLVMEKGSGARRVMWESFVKIRHTLPKLSRILKEIRDRGAGQFAYMDNERGLSEVPTHLKDVQRKHKETLRARTETLRVNTILLREKVKVFQLVDRYAELTVISTVRDRRLVEHELLARGRDHEKWREKHLRGELEKIRTDQLFQRNYSISFWGQIKRFFTQPTSGSSAAVAGVPGIGKTTMVQKIVYDWATGKIYPHFQFVFSFKFRDLNSINCRINLRELVLDQYPYFGNILGEVWKNPEGLLFIFDGLDEFKHTIDFTDSGRDTEPQHVCPDPEWRCEVSDIVYSLIQHKLLPGCSVLVTTRPTALHLLEKAEISVWAEILGFVGEERKEYFHRFFEDQTVAAAVFKHVEQNEILYTMSYNPSYCWILGLALGPFFSQRHKDPQRVPKTITQLYSYYIYNILKNHSREIESPRDVLLRVGQMAFTGVSERKIVFTDGDLIKYNLQPSQFLSGFLMELLEREDCARSVVYTFPHLTIQEFVAALAQFLTPDRRDILKLLTEAHSATDGRFEVFLRFVAGLSFPGSARGLEEFLGPFPHQTICRVIDWVKEEVKRQSGNTWSEAGKRSLLNTLHYLFESQNRGLAQAALGSVDTLSFSGLRLTPIDCAVLSHVIGLCDTIKHLDLGHCHIQCEGLQRLGPGLHKCLELGLDDNDLGDSGVKPVSAALRDPECKIQRLRLWGVGLTDSGAEDLASALSTNRSLTELVLGSNSLTDRCVPALRRLILTLPSLERIWLRGNQFSSDGRNQLESLQGTRPGLRVNL